MCYEIGVVISMKGVVCFMILTCTLYQCIYHPLKVVQWEWSQAIIGLLLIPITG